LASHVSNTVRSFRSASASVAASTDIVASSVAWNVNWVALLVIGSAGWCLRRRAGVSLQRASRPLQSAPVGRFDQVEAVGVVNLDMPIKGKVKQRIRYANAVSYRVARFKPVHERAFDLGDPDRGPGTEFFHLGVQGALFVFVSRVAHNPR
jgi:hypothetical protein